MTNTKLLVVGIFALLLSYMTNAEANPLNNTNSNSLNISASYLDEGSSYQTAALQFLPRYQGAYTSRNQDSDSKNKVCASTYKYSCTGTNESGGSGTACKSKYTACTCKAGFKWLNGSCKEYQCANNNDCTKGSGGICSGNKCTYEVIECNSDHNKQTALKSGDDGYLSNHSSWTGAQVGWSCEPCTAQTADGTQTTGLYNCTCNSRKLYPNGSSGSGSGGFLMTGAGYGIDRVCGGWNIVCPGAGCNANYYYSGGGCKPCAEGYYSEASRLSSPTGSTSCTKCGSNFQYTCAVDSTKHIKAGKGSSCSGKYAECQCDNELYSWNSSTGTCEMGCTKNSCKDSPIQKTSKTTLAVLQQSDSHISSVAECIPSCSGDNHGYTVTDCSGGYKVNAAGSGCTAYTAAELCDIHNSLCTGSKYSWEYYFANKALTCLLPKPAAN